METKESGDTPEQQRVLRASSVRRDLFDAAQTRLDSAQATSEMENYQNFLNGLWNQDVDSASKKWEFDFRKGVPCENSERFLWMKVPPETNNNTILSLESSNNSKDENMDYSTSPAEQQTEQQNMDMGR